MIAVALVDNGSLEPAATLSLRRLAAAVAAQTGKSVAPVSWKHSDRVPPDALGPVRAQTLRPWLEAKLAAGLRRFVFLPCFISDQGAIGTALADEVAAILAPFPPPGPCLRGACPRARGWRTWSSPASANAGSRRGCARPR